MSNRLFYYIICMIMRILPLLQDGLCPLNTVATIMSLYTQAIVILDSLTVMIHYLLILTGYIQMQGSGSNWPEIIIQIHSCLNRLLNGETPFWPGLK